MKTRSTCLSLGLITTAVAIPATAHAGPPSTLDVVVTATETALAWLGTAFSQTTLQQGQADAQTLATCDYDCQQQMSNVPLSPLACYQTPLGHALSSSIGQQDTAGTIDNIETGLDLLLAAAGVADTDELTIITDAITGGLTGFSNDTWKETTAATTAQLQALFNSTYAVNQFMSDPNSVSAVQGALDGSGINPDDYSGTVDDGTVDDGSGGGGGGGGDDGSGGGGGGGGGCGCDCGD